MSGAAAVIIGGGGNRTVMAKGFVYPMAVGDGVKNEGDENAHIRFTATSSGVATDSWVGPGSTTGFMEAGTLELL